MQESSRAVSRSLGALEHLSVAAQPLTNEQLARSLGIPASSTYRLLRKLVALGYVDFDTAGCCYSIGTRLGELGERLADVACRSLPIRQLVANLRGTTGYYVSIWVPSGRHVRIALLMSGIGDRPGLLLADGRAPPFSTPGIAISMSATDAEVRTLVRLCRKRHERLGRNFRTANEVLKAVRAHRQAGYVAAYNLIADGWSMLAWPIPITLEPRRMGAIVIGAPSDRLRAEEQQLVHVVTRERDRYSRVLEAARVS